MKSKPFLHPKTEIDELHTGKIGVSPVQKGEIKYDSRDGCPTMFFGYVEFLYRDLGFSHLLRFKRNMFKIEDKSTRNQFMEISNALV